MAMDTMMELRAVQQSLEGVGFERGTSDDYYTPLGCSTALT